jgi:hypothetical protein
VEFSGKRTQHSHNLSTDTASSLIDLVWTAGQVLFLLKEIVDNNDRIQDPTIEKTTMDNFSPFSFITRMIKKSILTLGSVSERLMMFASAFFPQRKSISGQSK